MKITILTDDNADPSGRLQSEHGLSVYAELGDKRYLFDVGRTNIFADNAVRLGIDLSLVDYVILTHGHYDHANGLNHFLQKNQRARIILSKQCVAERLYSFKKGVHTFIGMDPHLQYVDRERIIFLNEENFDDGPLTILTSVSHQHRLPLANRTLYKKREEKYLPDDFSHEIIPCLSEENGLTLFTGCAHQGLVNILEAVQRHFPGIPIKAVIGGFHYVNSKESQRYETDEELRRIAEMLVRIFPGTTFHTGHCTGDQAIRTMQDVSGFDIQPFYPGYKITLGKYC